MSNLKNSIAFLFFYVILVFGIAQVRFIEDNVLNFEPAFFILVSLAVLSGLYFPISSRFTIYPYLMTWAAFYGLVWLFYWRTHIPALNAQLLGIQFLLVIIGAGLSYDVGRHLDGISALLEGLSASTYPNRTLEIKNAEDRISAELTRSRRYHHPLSLLLVELDKKSEAGDAKAIKGVQKDLLHRFAVARIGQIISDRARETDLVLRDRAGRFLLLCPETNSENSLLFGDRIRRAVMESMGADVNWSFASFPEDALTFEELVEFAEHRLGILDPSQSQEQTQTQDQEALV
ncbi:MAG: hypothetical protein HY867_03595 [Chloroflexi bacterium]|nr:hypothetical protein [Chloroflexota bacterium]